MGNPIGREQGDVGPEREPEPPGAQSGDGPELDRKDIERYLMPTFRVAVRALERSKWRIGMPADALVAPILVAILVDLGTRLPLAELRSMRASRCRSCDHLLELHHEDGCAYTVGEAAEGREPACPCTVPRHSA